MILAKEIDGELWVKATDCEQAISRAVTDERKQVALDKKAENARELGLDYEPAQQEPVGCEGAIVNGRVYADRLEHDYKFECEVGPLHLCTDWVEFRRCFEWLAQHTSPPAQRTWVGLTDEEIEQGCKESWVTEQAFQSAVWWAEAKLKEKNT